MATFPRVLLTLFVGYWGFVGVVIVVNLYSPTGRFDWLGLEGCIIGLAILFSIVAGYLVWSGKITQKSFSTDSGQENIALPLRARIKRATVVLGFCYGLVALVYAEEELSMWLQDRRFGNWKDFDLGIFLAIIITPVVIIYELIGWLKERPAKNAAESRHPSPGSGPGSRG